MTDVLPERRLGEFLDAVAARTPHEGAGAVAAVTVASAAALVAMAARFSEGDLRSLAVRADRLRDEVLPLADADGHAYGALLAAQRIPRDQPERRQRIDDALEAATDIPVRIAEAGSQVAEMGARLVSEGNPRLIGDAQTAALLADAATRAAHGLVRINTDLASRAGVDWADRAETFRQRASAAAQSATEKTLSLAERTG